MSQQYREGVGDRTEWLLRLLYAPDRHGKENIPLFGRTRLMKAAFLIDRKFEENFDRQTDFDFEPHKYGPFDKGVLDAIEQLANEDLVIITEPSNHHESYDLVKYELTKTGAKQGRSLYTELRQNEQRLIRWIKNERAMQKMGRLLTSVYNEYPHMTVESELV